MSTKVARKVPRSLLAVLAKGWALIVGTAVVFGIGALAFSLAQEPQYAASTALYITAGGTGETSGYDTVEASKQRVGTYAQLVHSGAVLTPALETAGLDWSLEEARKHVVVESRPDIVTLTVDVQAADPQVAQRFADAIADSMTAAVEKLEVPASGFEPAAKLSVVTPATVASAPATPTTEFNVVVAAVLGLFVGVALVLLREVVHKRVRDAEEAEIILGTKVLAVLDGAPHNTGRHTVFDGEPASSVAAFRDLRSRLIVELGDDLHPTVLFTSARTGEGKTAVAVNVAVALAHAAKSVVVVEADIQDPQVVETVGARPGPGLTDVVGGRLPVSDALQHGGAGLTSLAVMGAGTNRSSYPEGLFASADLMKVLDDLARQFDYVIIDAPALLGNSGTESLVSSADGVVVVTRPKVSTIADLTECRTRLSDAGARVLGIVLSARSKESRHRKVESNA